ncbi:MAG: hypothetical protein ACYDCK_07710 [Thermoplasmatota archaeon]
MSSAFSGLSKDEASPSPLPRAKKNLVRVSVMQALLAGVALLLFFVLDGKRAGISLALLFLPAGVEFAAVLYWVELKRAVSRGLYSKEFDRAATKRANARLGLGMAAWILSTAAVILL